MVRQVPLPKRNFETACLRMKRVEVHHDQDAVEAPRRSLCVIDDLVVERVVEPYVQMALQRRFVFSQRVERRDFADDVPGSLPVAYLYLVFLDRKSVV